MRDPKRHHSAARYRAQPSPLTAHSPQSSERSSSHTHVNLALHTFKTCGRPMHCQTTLPLIVECMHAGYREGDGTGEQQPGVSLYGGKGPRLIGRIPRTDFSYRRTQFLMLCWYEDGWGICHPGLPRISCHLTRFDPHTHGLTSVYGAFTGYYLS